MTSKGFECDPVEYSMTLKFGADLVICALFRRVAIDFCSSSPSIMGSSVGYSIHLANLLMISDFFCRGKPAFFVEKEIPATKLVDLTGGEEKVVTSSGQYERKLSTRR